MLWLSDLRTHLILNSILSIQNQKDMADKEINKRRQFLKNTTLAAFSAALLPELVSASEKPLAISEQLECDPTTLDFYGQGPFYTAGPPEIVDNALATDNEPGVKLTIFGRVRNLDCTEFIPDVLIDVWQADDAGQYDNNGYNLRGFTHSNSQGFYTFETIFPGKYLNGSSFRPAHIHFRITPVDHPMLITQLYFAGDTDIADDAAASITSGQYDATDRIIKLTTLKDDTLEGAWDIIVDGDGVVLSNDLHLDKGIIYSAGPNPFSDRIEIKYGVFRNALVSLLVYDMEGKLVSTLEEQKLEANKYTAIWEPTDYMPNGIYFIALKINEIQVHYLKVIRVSSTY